MVNETASPATRSLSASSVVNLSTLLPVLGLFAAYTTYQYLHRTITSVLPFTMTSDTTALLASHSSTTLILRHGTLPRPVGYRDRLQSLCQGLWDWLCSWTDRERAPYAPIVNNENPSWEDSEPNSEGWRHSPFLWEPSPRFPRGSEDSEFERRWAPRDELAPHVRARIEREEREEREGLGGTIQTSGARADSTRASGANNSTPNLTPNGDSASTPISPRLANGSVTGMTSQQGSDVLLSDLEPVHPIDWSLNGFGL